MIPFPKLRILISAFALMLGTPAHADHIKVFLLGGQSNMQGNNALLNQLPPALQPPQDDVLLYSGTNAAAFFGSLQVGAGNNFGPEISFGRTIADGRPYDRFCLIKFAQGATNLHSQWDPTSGSVYTEFRRTVTYGLDALTKAGHTYEIVGILWTQGENDVQDFRTTAQYEADLNEFIADVRTRYGTGVKFFISRLSDNQTWRDITQVRTAQDNVAASDPLSYLIDTDGFEMRNDNLHFEETGYVAIGEAFGQSYLNSLPVDPTEPAISTLSPAHTISGVDPTADLTITFTEDILFGTGAIRLIQTGGTLVETFDVASPSANLTLSGATLTINPTALLSPTTGYYLEIDATAIDDLAGNSFIGISGDGTWSFTTSAADTTAPTLASLSPAHTATGVLFNSNLHITFSENIAFGTGEIRLRQAGGALVQSFDVANPPAGLSISGRTLTINPTVDLSASTGYHVEIDATSIDDHAGNSFPGFTGDGTWSFTTTAALIDGAKITATASIHSGPTAMPFMTIDGSGLSGGVYGTAASTKWNTPTVNITNHWIQWNLGASYTLDSIRVWNYKDQFVSSIKSVDIYFSNAPIPGDPEGVGAGNWTKLGGASVQLPDAPDSPNTGFDLETATSTTLPDTEVRYIRFELNTNWQESTSYRTGLAEIQFTAMPGGPDVTPTGVSLLSPAHTATGVPLASNLSITFNENVAFGTGAIRLLQSGGTLIESFDVASPPVGLTLTGATVTLNPTVDLSPSTTYYIEIDATAIEDLAGNSFTGFSGDGAWSFTTIVPDTTAPTISTLNPPHGASDINTFSNFVITFSEDVAFGTGNIRLRKSGGALVESFDVATPSTGLSLSGNTVTIDPAAGLSLSTTYYIEIDATAIDDLVGNSFAGFSGNGTWSFSTSVANPSALIYEPFNYSAGNINGTQSGAVGTIGSWTQTQVGGGSGLWGVVSSGLSFTGLSTEGGAAQRTNANGGSEISIGVSPAAQAGLLGDNTTIYFSLLVRNNHFSAGNEGLAFVLGSGAFDVNGPDRTPPTITGGEGFGIHLSALSNFSDPASFGNSIDIYGYAIDGGTAIRSTGKIDNPDGVFGNTFMIVGRIEWAANGSNDTLTLYNVTDPTAGLPESPFATITADLDQSAFDTLAIANRQVSTIDEIRFGNSLTNVGVTEVDGGNTFADWIGGFSGLGGLTAFGDDADGDGIKNGVEAFFGTAPNAPNAGLSAVAVSGSSFTFIHPEADPPLTDVTGSYEWSLDLSTWKASGDDVGGTIVTIGAVQNTPESGATTVTASVTGTAPGKVFVRAVATQN